MTTRFDDDEDPEFDPPVPDHDPDDPLLVLLAPDPAYLGAAPGRFDEIRRTATRRRRVRTAAGVGMVCAVAALVALPFTLTSSQTPSSPTVPMAPPVPTSPATPPADHSLTPVPAPATPRPSDPATTDPGEAPSPGEAPTEASDAPSQMPGGTSAAERA